ncbi:MAG: NAD(P)-dependent oxidoreductase [Hyalangium sp.]|uniref:NAD(P)-dependent oxidoreductase n=1 Tax=Hyalangium sp. TaxID=2028555 RepID=UPI00389B007E
MRLVIFGATGGAGRELVTQALEAGHEVTAVARNPASVSARHERLTVVQADVQRPDSVTRAIAGQDAVVLSVGPRPGTPPGTLTSDATRHVLEGMRQSGVRRLVYVSGVMVGEARGVSALKRAAIALFRLINRSLYLDKVKAERLVFDSPVSWTIVRPPLFGEVPPRGHYRLGEDLDVKLVKMANQDVAASLLAALTNAQYERKALELSY